MGKPTVNWNSVQTWERVVAAMYASGLKPDLKTVAIYFGTTYDTLENRLRKVKQEAATMKAEIDGGEPAPARPTSTNSTPRKAKASKKDPLNTVANGRVTKSTSVKAKNKDVKQENKDSDDFMDLTNATDYNGAAHFNDEGPFAGSMSLDDDFGF